MVFQLFFNSSITFCMSAKDQQCTFILAASLDFVLIRHVGQNLDFSLISHKFCTALIYSKCCFLLFSAWVQDSDLLPFRVTHL